MVEGEESEREGQTAFNHERELDLGSVDHHQQHEVVFRTNRSIRVLEQDVSKTLDPNARRVSMNSIMNKRKTSGLKENRRLNRNYGSAKLTKKLRQQHMFNQTAVAANNRMVMARRTRRKRVNFRVNGEEFVLYDYYIPTRTLRKCANACVCEAINKKTGKTAIIKKNKSVFKDLLYAKRLLREIKLMMHFDHEDIVGLIGVIPPDVSEIDIYEDVYLVMQKMDLNLSQVIKSKQKLTDRHYQLIIYQLLRGLKYIHSAGVIHRDLKPENILINGADCNLKIAGFGLARGVSKEEMFNLTEYVMTRWYRAPEVMCSAKQYNQKVDVWSVGCIFAELLLRKPIFPGRNHLEQLKMIFSMLGTPEPGGLAWIKNEGARHWIQRMQPSNGRNLKKIFYNASPKALELLILMLQFDPNIRISVVDGLEHPYFEGLHDPTKEVTCEKFDTAFETNFESAINTPFGIRHIMYQELKNFKRSRKSKLQKRYLQI